ncbi:Protein of unknown function [Alteromonadaceae bacterium Bs31]|nr:Protein of unknown function [Alteromonadaceae bacterium Bs31]
MSVAALKITIIVLFIAVVASLTSGLVFLIKDMGVAESKRTVYALGVRVTLVAALLLVIGYGIYSGKLSNTAPWGDHRQTATPVQH